MPIDRVFAKRSRQPLFSASGLVCGAALLLGVTGVLTIASGSMGGQGADILFFKQVLFLFFGFIVMSAAAALPFGWWRRCALPLGIFGMAVLWLLPLFGIRVNGMCGWLNFGGLYLQPSEVMKAPFLLVLSLIAARFPPGDRRSFAGALLWTVLWVIPILLQPDFGTAAIYCATFFALCFVTGGKLRHLALPLGAGAAAAAAFVWRHPYAWRRIGAFIDPAGDPLGSSWHARQFELAIARGHIFGSKLGGAVWSGNYLPYAYNDSAFATLLETLGLAGGSLAAVLLILLASSLWRLAVRSDADDARVFITGAMLLIVIQSSVHIGVNLCLLPTTGLTMPFISYGGSSLTGCFWLAGIALSAGKHTNN